MDGGVFCGRVGLLRTLDGLLSRARAEGTRLVVLHGQAGVGKSALLVRLGEARPPGSLLRLPLAALRGGWAYPTLTERGRPPGREPAVVAFDGDPDPRAPGAEEGLATPLAELAALAPTRVWVVALRSEPAARSLAAVPGSVRIRIDPLGRADAALLAAELLEPSRLPVDARLIARVVRLVGGRPAWLRALALRLASPGAIPRGTEDPVQAALLAEVVGPAGRIGAACRSLVEGEGLDASEQAMLGGLARRFGLDALVPASGLGIGPLRARDALARLAARGLVVEGPGGPTLADPVLGLWLRLERLGGGLSSASTEAARAYEEARRLDPGPSSDLGAWVLGLASRCAGRDLPGALVGERAPVRMGEPHLEEIPVVFDATGEVEGVPAVLAADARVATPAGDRLLCIPRLARPVGPGDLGALARLAALVARRERLRSLGLWVVAAEGFEPEARAGRDGAWLTDGEALDTWARDEHVLAA